jgi:2-dehydro-3-deoxygalactonokinase
LTSSPAFAAVDWGTSSFRLWLVSDNGAVLTERRSGDGMTAAREKGFAATLDAHLAALDAPAGLPAVVCGMAGARQGWVEANYLDVPASLEEIVSRAVSPDDTDRRVFILPGLAQRRKGHADVIRGEETQLMGAVANRPETGAGLYCMPGTHSKWVRFESAKVSGFSTFMTGELFDLVARRSILAHSISEAAVDPQRPSFAEAVRSGHDETERLTASLFSIRGSQLLFGDPPETAADRLSGLLIGAELAGGGCKNAAEPICLIASGRLAALYRAAFATLSIAIEEIDADQAVRQGLVRAARSLGLLDARKGQTA